MDSFGPGYDVVSGTILTAVGLALFLGRKRLVSTVKGLSERIGETWSLKAVKIGETWNGALGILMMVDGIVRLLK